MKSILNNYRWLNNYYWPAVTPCLDLSTTIIYVTAHAWMHKIVDTYYLQPIRLPFLG